MGSDFSAARSRSIVRELTDKVSDMLSDIFVGFRGEDDGLKLCGCGEEGGILKICISKGCR